MPGCLGEAAAASLACDPLASSLAIWRSDRIWPLADGDSDSVGSRSRWQCSSSCGTLGGEVGDCCGCLLKRETGLGCCGGLKTSVKLVRSSTLSVAWIGL